jgi:poly(3-hydroxybutyrate) depolymerase
VLVFHGGGGSGAGTERFTRFSDLSDREGFLAAYPDGIGHSWNDGREIAGSRAHRERKFFKAHPKP